ncbi:metallophosphoesterase [Gorillibacterium timonense]|uniref:metallophosphoesterase n=1 Tax=Gorillibacterium timonense TaxID=1689269 RepID=UPI00071C29A0|nr:metallophosphoesterase [Gorillibacterium timonense]
MKWRSLSLLIMSLLSLILLSSCRGVESGSESSSSSKPNSSPSSHELYLATDLHYLAPSLHDNGKAFQEYIKNGDSKLLNYSDELVEAWVHQVIQDKPKAVVLSGDLTNNGEKASHEQLANKLQAIKDAGIGVYVIPGNHDISNPWARSFKDDKQIITDYISPQDFEDLYAPFGYQDAASRDESSLSYLTKLSDELWLLMLDTSDYKQNVELGAPETGGYLSDSTLQWITEQGALAKQADAHVIAVMHHNLIDHSEYSFMGFTLTNDKKALSVLKDAGIKLVLSGHIHLQDIRSKDQVYDIATSAFEVYPHQFGVLDYSSTASTIEYHTEPVDVEGWSKATGNTNRDLRHFTDFSTAFFRDSSYGKAYRSLESKGYTEEERQSMANVMADVNLHYFAGTTTEIDPNVLNSKGMELWKKADSQFLKSYVLSMIKEPKENNHLVLPLSPDH